MADIILCHSPEDAAGARMLADAIGRAGYDVAAIDAPSAAVTEQIASAKAAIVLWSDTADDAEWLRAEANVARGLRKLVQVSADGRPPPVPFDPAKSISILTWKGEEDHPAWRGIAAALLELCGPPPERTAPPPEPTPTIAAAPLADPEPEPEREPESLSTPAPSSGPSPLLIVAIVLALLAVAAVAWYLTREPAGEAPSGANEAAAQSLEATDKPVPAEPTADVPPEPPLTPEQFDREAVVQGSGPMIVRNVPSERGLAVTRVEGGERVSTFDQDGSWWRIRTMSGRTGFLPAESLRLDGAELLPPDALPPASTPPARIVRIDPPRRPAARPQPPERRPPARPRGSRIRKENSEVMQAFCEGAGYGTPQCRAFDRQLGN